MILESLKALVTAGRNAVQTTCGLPVTCEHIQQVSQGTITFPAMGEVQLKGAPVQHIHVGCDAMLASQMAELVGNKGDDSGISVLVKEFLRILVANIGGRNPSGEIVSLDVGPRSVHTRGLRTFGFRFETALGQLYLLAEIPSRMELELAKGSGFVPSLIRNYLPSDWENIESFDRTTSIENFLIFMRKGEADIHLEIPRQDGTTTVHTGFLVEQIGDRKKRLLKFTVDLAKEEAQALRMGQPIPAKVGIQDRSLEFDLNFNGFAKAHVEGQADVNGMLFSVPEKIRIMQRRQAFRISLSSSIRVEMECAESVIPEELSFSDDGSMPVFRGHLMDLSFSGARIMGTQGNLVSCGGTDKKVKCRIYFQDNGAPLEIFGIVRRNSSTQSDHGHWTEEIGLEFMIAPGINVTALESIRQYILAEQRTWLAKRVSVAGVDNW